MKEVFEAHLNVDKIWSVDGMPFLDYKQALNYAGGREEKIQPHSRFLNDLVEDKKAELTAKAEAEKAEADAKAKAEAEKAEADAKAKAEAEKAESAKSKK